jgi:hypothetical protein
MGNEKFDVIKGIDADDPGSWENKLFLTLDIDWVHDEVLADTIDVLESYSVSATFFVTHKTPVLERLRENPKFELGIHPNFNFLLQGDFRNGKDAEEVIDRMLEIVPDAKSVRSHSLTQSSRILDLFGEKGLTHDCNHFIPEQLGIELKPWKHWNNMVKAPHFWEDDIVCVSPNNTSVEFLVKRPGLRVFDFHPIHVFLNTEELNRYERSRTLHQDPKSLLDHRYDGYGTRSRLLDLLGFRSDRT